MTNGHVMAGFHEVVVTDKTLATVEAKKARKESCWRVSSTLFSHLRSDGDLEPLRAPGDLFGEPNAQKYPKMKVGAYVAEELKAINLSNSKTAEEEQEEQKGSKVEA